ncbi:MAG: acyl-CoA thioesterase [Azonexus sp.]|jgi:acyl-CoA thioester hydrolase|nr:acyl-CoA thioesterase [Azonexus sp.]
MEPQKKLAHVTHLPIRWGDQDAFGHVNNTVYFRYMEQARIEWVESLGFKTWLGDEGPVIVHASCTFLRQMTYPGTVEVRTSVGRPGRSSFQTYVDMQIDGELFAAGTAKIVWVNRLTGKSTPLPESLRALLEAE